jgi:hypothetical protein
MAVALGWIALGVAIAIGAFRMDRLAHLNVEPWSAPGLVPGVLGVLIAVFGALLAGRERAAARGAAAGVDASTGSTRSTASTASTGPTGPSGPSGPSGPTGAAASSDATASTAARMAGVLALVAVFAFGLLGRGLPFVATSSALVFAWIALLRWREWRAAGRLAPGLAGAAAIALGACFAIAHLFQDVFLVRLP